MNGKEISILGSNGSVFHFVLGGGHKGVYDCPTPRTELLRSTCFILCKLYLDL